jgi:hypothetical protein
MHLIARASLLPAPPSGPCPGPPRRTPSPAAQRYNNSLRRSARTHARPLRPHAPPVHGGGPASPPRARRRARLGAIISYAPPLPSAARNPRGRAFVRAQRARLMSHCEAAGAAQPRSGTPRAPPSRASIPLTYPTPSLGPHDKRTRATTLPLPPRGRLLALDPLTHPIGPRARAVRRLRASPRPALPSLPFKGPMASRNMHSAATTTSSTCAARARDIAGAEKCRARAAAAPVAGQAPSRAARRLQRLLWARSLHAESAGAEPGPTCPAAGLAECVRGPFPHPQGPPPARLRAPLRAGARAVPLRPSLALPRPL